MLVALRALRSVAGSFLLGSFSCAVVSVHGVRASMVCGSPWPLFVGTRPCALVAAGGVHVWRASWPHVGAPKHVWSGCSRCSGRLSFCHGAFPYRGLSPPDLLGRCQRHMEAALELGSRSLPLAPAVAGALDSIRVVPVRGSAMRMSLAGPSGVGLGLRALRWFGGLVLSTFDGVIDW